MHTGSDSTQMDSSGSRLLVWGGGILCAIGALIFFAFDPTKVPIFPQCVFHQLTGLDCPGCGAQRALHQLLHGNLIAALQLNAMFVLSLPLAVWYMPRFISSVVKGATAPLNTRWLLVYVGTWLLFGVLRNLPFPACHWFFAA